MSASTLTAQQRNALEVFANNGALFVSPDTARKLAETLGCGGRPLTLYRASGGRRAWVRADETLYLIARSREPSFLMDLRVVRSLDRLSEDDRALMRAAVSELSERILT